MNIFVIMKRTFDTEEKIVVRDGRIVSDDAKFIINPYDEYAIEEAIQLRDQHGGEVTVVSVGDEDTETELRTALAMGCDKAALIHYGTESRDPSTTAKILAAYLGDKQADLIIGGIASVDGGSGQVGPRVAELLEIPYITSVVKIHLDGNVASVHRDVEGDLEILESRLPLLFTAQQGLNEPRYPSLPGIMKAKKKPLDVYEIDDLGLEAASVAAKAKTVEISLPPKRAEGRIMQGDLGSQVKELATLLYNEEKVI